MTEKFDRRSSSRTRAQLEAARTAGAWMPWAAGLLAGLSWAGIGAWLYTSVGVNALLAQPPLTIATGAALFLVPGLVLICAGMMARESRRSSEANALVLASARLLLEPADQARLEISTIAEAVTRETQNVNKALTDTRTKMDALKHDIEASVTGALKAAEIVRRDSEVLVSKMSAERQSLMQVSESLRGQAESLSKAIPRHAQIMSEAARAAQEEVRKADATLDQRLRGVDEAARHLADRIAQLDTMGAESRKRAQNLAGALSRMDEQLVQSTRMVDAAVRAGELATAASKGTADSLRDAMSDALNSALKASETIASQSAAASEDARTAMNRLKEMGLQAEATTRSATLAARAQADETEQRINQLSEFLFRAENRVSSETESGLDKARQRIERASLLINQMKDEPDTSSVDDLLLEPAAVVRPQAPPPVSAPPARAEVLRPVLHKPTATADFETAMREAGVAEEVLAVHRNGIARAAASPAAPPAAAPVQSSHAQPPPSALFASRAEVSPSHVTPVHAAPAPAAQSHVAPAPPAAPPLFRSAPLQPIIQPAPAPAAEISRAPGLSWRDLLTGIEDAAPQQREQNVTTMIDRLDRAGVRLTHVVKASDLRRIASAAHQGERQRRRVIRDVAPSEIQRVVRLLDADRDLQVAAKTFVAVEEPDALRVLATADRAREDAAPRLSAYLLLDAALGAVL